VVVSARARCAVVAAFLVAACARDRAATPDSAAATVRVSAQAAGAAKPACPRTGHWSPCQVRTRLDQAGVAPRTADASMVRDLPALAATPIIYQVGSAGLAIYLFPDTAARARAGRSLDTARFIASARALSMRGEATAIQSDNLLALLFSRNEQQRERVSDALTAGPPQP
jgi:hypothetical protein